MYIWNKLLSAIDSRLTHSPLAVLSGLIFLFVAQLSWSLGLGELNADSHLGQPLTVSIEIIGDTSDVTQENILVRQVSSGEAAAMGIEVLSLVQKIDFETQRSGNGYIINVSSKQDVDEPFFNIFLELRWPKGVVYKEYAVLLDPPSIALSRAAAVAANNTTSDATRIAPASNQSNTNRASTGASTSNDLAAGAQTYQVKSGDNLSIIAGRVSTNSGLSAKDVSDWIVENNPRAFIRGNPNLIRAGAVLALPEPGESPSPNQAAVAESIEPQDSVSEAQDLAPEESAVVQEETSNSASEGPRGLLTVTALSSDDRAEELMDMLSRENQSLKEKLDKMENSEYLDTMKEVAKTQREQIAQLQDRLGVDGQAYREKADEILQEMKTAEEAQSSALSDVTVQSMDGTGEFDNPENATKGVIKIDALVPEALRADAKKRNYFFFWLITSAVIFFALLFIGMYIYYRHLVKARDELALNTAARLKRSNANKNYANRVSLPYGNQSNTPKPARDLDRPIDIPKPEVTHEPEPTQIGKKNADWFGEQLNQRERREKTYQDTVKQIQEDFATMSTGKSSESDDTPTFETNDEYLEGMTSQLHGGKSSDDNKVTGLFGRKKKKDDKKGPSDEDLKSSIAEKMSHYSPSGSAHSGSAYGLDAFSLDELLGEDDMIGDEVDSVIYRAKLYCEARKYKQALNLIETSMESVEDDRLQDEYDRISKFVKVEEKPSTTT